MSYGINMVAKPVVNQDSPVVEDKPGSSMEISSDRIKQDQITSVDDCVRIKQDKIIGVDDLQHQMIKLQHIVESLTQLVEVKLESFGKEISGLSSKIKGITKLTSKVNELDKDLHENVGRAVLTNVKLNHLIERVEIIINNGGKAKDRTKTRLTMMIKALGMN